MTPAFFFLKWITARLDVAYKRLEWKHEIAKAEAWRAECLRRFQAMSIDMKRKMEAESLWRRLWGSDRARREGRRKGVRIHDENKHDGPVGYQSCSESQWDNTVRAAEEDR